MTCLHPRQLLAVVVTTVSVAACVNDEGVTPPNRRASVESDQSSATALAKQYARQEIERALQGGYERGIESVLLRIEVDVPGFGGMYFDPELGRMVVLVTTASQSGRAVAAVRDYLDRAPPTPTRQRALSAAIEVRTADYAFSELVGWTRALFGPLLRVPAFHGLDADERSNRVVITIEDVSATPRVESVVSGYGVPLAAVRIETKPRAQALVAGPAPAQSAQSPQEISPLWGRTTNLRAQWRPAIAGVEIQNERGGRCSHGFTVWTGAGGTGGMWGFLSADHCSRYGPFGDQTGESIYQDDAPNDFLAHVQWNKAWGWNQPECIIDGIDYEHCTRADAMFMWETDDFDSYMKVAKTMDPNTNNRRGSIDVSEGHTYEVLAPIMDGGAIGWTVYKVGRTTGETYGTISISCKHKVISYDNGSAAVLCMNATVDLSVGEGDSGGPVFLRSANADAAYPLGIVVAGGPLNRIDFDDGVRYCEEPQAPATCEMWYSHPDMINAHFATTFHYDLDP